MLLMCDRHVRAWRKGSRERGWDERYEIRGLAEKDAKVLVCGSWTVAKRVEEARKKLRMEWQGGCCGVEEAENWLEESKGPTIWQTFSCSASMYGICYHRLSMSTTRCSNHRSRRIPL